MPSTIRTPTTAEAGMRPKGWLYRPRTRVIVLYVLLVGAFLLGGGARADINSLVLLRPLAIFCGAYAMASVTREQLNALGLPLWILLMLIALVGLQLVPLPPALWSALPGRELIAQILRDTGLGNHWRPLTLTPGRTTNTLFSLFVPLGVFLLAAIQPRSDRGRLIWPILGLGIASAVLGLMQVIGPDRSPLYLYRITNPGNAVGLFANRNHNAIFLASVIPLLAYVALRARRGGQAGAAILAGCTGALLLIFPLLLVNGSRAGTAAATALLAVSAALWWLHTSRHSPTGVSSTRNLERVGGLVVLGSVGALVALTWGMSRSLVSERLLDESLADELRVKALPVVLRMIAEYFPVGSGFGSFDLAYKIVEPDKLLMTKFLNQAHNDWLQPLIEGGLPAGLLMALGLAWFIRAGWRSWRLFLRSARDSREAVDPALFAWLSLSALLAGSLVDYPLRTPSLMVVAVLLCCTINRSVRNERSRPNAAGSRQ